MSRIKESNLSLCLATHVRQLITARDHAPRKKTAESTALYVNLTYITNITNNKYKAAEPNVRTEASSSNMKNLFLISFFLIISHSNNIGPYR